MTAALILDIMAATGKKLSELVAEQLQYFIEKGKVECPNEKKEELLKTVLDQVKEKNISKIDGVRIWFEDKSAILIRYSGSTIIFPKIPYCYLKSCIYG